MSQRFSVIDGGEIALDVRAQSDDIHARNRAGWARDAVRAIGVRARRDTQVEIVVGGEKIGVADSSGSVVWTFAKDGPLESHLREIDSEVLAIVKETLSRATFTRTPDVDGNAIVAAVKSIEPRSIALEPEQN